jgi:ankyrin repeat protein
LKQAAGVNVRAADGTVPLHWAVRGDQVAIVDLLIHAGAQVNVADRYGVTPLMLAATNGNPEIVARLVKAGADVNAGLPEGQTVLMTAARTGQPDALTILLAHGADPNARERWIGETGLMWAAAENHGAAVKILLDAGADPMPSYPTTFKRWRTDGAHSGRLHRRDVCSGTARSTLQALAEAGGSRHDVDGMSALTIAIINAHYDVAACCWKVPIRASPTRQDSPLHRRHEHAAIRACRRKHSGSWTRSRSRSSCSTVARANATLDGQSCNTQRTSPDQVQNDAAHACRQVRRCDADAGTAQPRSRSSLRQENNSTLLIWRRVRPGSSSRTPTRRVRARHSDDLLQAVQLSWKLRLDVNAVNDAGETALRVALGKMVRYLVEKGAKLDAKNREGRTPLRSRCRAGQAGANPPEAPRAIDRDPGPVNIPADIMALP